MPVICPKCKKNRLPMEFPVRFGRLAAPCKACRVRAMLESRAKRVAAKLVPVAAKVDPAS